MSGYLHPGPTRVIVNIGAVDTVNRMCSGMFADGSECGNIINVRNQVGAVQVTPAVGEQWIIEMQGSQWMLVSQLPIHTPQLSGVTQCTPGQVQIGSSGPLELFGSTINAHAPIRLSTYATAERPSAPDAGPGAMIYDTTLSKPVFSDGTTWRDAGGDTA